MIPELLRLLILQLAFGAHRLLALPDASAWLFLVPLGELFFIRLLLDVDRNTRIAAGLQSFALTLLVAVLLAFNAGEFFYRLFYLQRFNPWTDLALIPGLVRLLAPTLPVSDSVLRWVSVSLATLFLGSLARGVVWALQRTYRRRADAHSRRFPGTNGVLALAGALLILILPGQSPLIRVARDAYRTLRVREPPAQAAPPDAGQAPTGSASDRSPAAAPTPGLRDADLHLIVVESYGATLLQRPEYHRPMQTLYAELERELAGAGYTVLSGTVQSPAFGGRSWLADATLLTGIQIADQLTYDRLAAGEEPARLLALAGGLGYHRVYAAPGTRTAPEEWRWAYPFDRYLLRYDFEYTGPFISFGALPDQYLLDYAARTALLPDQKDFALYLLVSSHVPFEVIPVYREAWDFTRAGLEFEDEGALRRFENNWLGGTELAEGYLAGINYSLRSSVGLFTRRLQGLNLGLIVGDHQPRKPVSHAGADYQVPFHLILPRNLYTEDLAAVLAERKLIPGFEPHPDPAAPDMNRIASLLETLAMTEQ